LRGTRRAAAIMITKTFTTEMGPKVFVIMIG